jgi:hypothetical protein
MRAGLGVPERLQDVQRLVDARAPVAGLDGPVGRGQAAPPQDLSDAQHPLALAPEGVGFVVEVQRRHHQF